MSDPATFLKSRPARAFALLLFAGAFASCSGNSEAPVAPPAVDDHPAPKRMFSVIGSPRVAVSFNGNLTEPNGALAPVGSFAVILYDSVGRRVFLDDVRLNGVVMRQEFDGLGLPSRYLLNANEVPGLVIGDTIRFEAVDGGAITTPFTYVILPSHLKLPPDSTVIHEDENLRIPWTGSVERVIVTLTDSQGLRLRNNLQFENSTGQTELVIPARDLARLAVGDIQVGTDVLDTELVLSSGQSRQEVDFETRQRRLLRLEP